MSWKRAVFFGGAVLVLSACADATAPGTLSQVDRSIAAAKKTTATSDSTVSLDGQKSDECTGVVIHVGIDGSLVPVCVLTTPTVNW